MAYYCVLHTASGNQPSHPELTLFLNRLKTVLSQTLLPDRVVNEKDLGKRTEKVLFKALAQEFGEAFWKHDQELIHVERRDRADLYAQQPFDSCLYTIIIEADPTRGDSIAKKFVSRVACVTTASLIYVTFCYKGTQKGTVFESKKYMEYCASISSRLSSENNQVLYFGFMPGT